MSDDERPTHYCDDCADDRADSDNHRAIGKVTRR
jgi:hypothetical protein